jgi:hypothetical protein
MASLFEIPAPRFVEGVRINHRSRPDWNLSVWPKLPWKFLKGPGRVKSGINFEEYVQGTTMYPLFESLSWSSTYFWKDNPFVVFDQSPVGKRFFSVDYLMLYRVAKESGLVDDET